MSQVQQWIEDIVEQFRQAKDLDELLNLGVYYLRTQYVPELVKQCWAEFTVCLANMAPNDNGYSVVAVDVPAIFYAAFARTPDSAGEVVSAVKSRMDSIYEDTACDSKGRFILAVDGKKNWRKDKFPEYKCKRQPKPSGFAETFAQAMDAVMDSGYKIVEYDEYESDDILASVSYRAKLRRHSCVLVTDDRDLWQCLGMGTVMYSPRTRDYFNEDNLRAQHSITAKQAVDWLSLVGKNDVPSAVGIGEKNASELLCKYGNFWGVFDATDDLPEAKAKSIRDFAYGKYWMARELLTLQKGLEVRW